MNRDIGSYSLDHIFDSLPSHPGNKSTSSFGGRSSDRITFEKAITPRWRKLKSIVCKMEKVPEGMIIPPELEFKPSGMEADQIGVWSKRMVKQDETYGPFLGVKKKLAEVHDDTYSWEIRGPKGRRLFCIDASDPTKGNWMRYVKSARYFEEQNMIAMQDNKNIFYKTLRDIPAGEELLCWYNSGDPPSEEMHEAAQRKAKAKSAKEAAGKQATPNASKSSKQGTKSGGKTNDVLGDKLGKSGSDKASIKGGTDKSQSGKQQKQSTATSGTGSKLAQKPKQISTEEAEEEQNKEDTSRRQSKKDSSKGFKVTDNNEKLAVGDPATKVDDALEESAKVPVPTTLAIGEQPAGAPVVKLVPLGPDVNVQDHQEVKEMDLIAADGNLKSPDMPVLENMTKEGFVIPSPSKQVHTTWSSKNGSVAATKEVIVGGVVCHEISPPTISPVLPITKNQAASLKETTPSTKNDLAADVVTAAMTIVAASMSAETEVKDTLAIQAPDVSSTEESSGTEKEMQDDGDKEIKESHVTSSKSHAQENRSVDSKGEDHPEEVQKTDIGENSEKTESDTSPTDESADTVKEQKQKVVSKKKGKKQKPIYKCHVCGSVFGKPVHVKIHIAKKHGLQGRKPGSKVKVFVPGKREKIRTRSVSTKEKVTDRLHTQNVSGKEKVKEAEKAKRPSEDFAYDVNPEAQIKTKPVTDNEAEMDTPEKAHFSDKMLSRSASMVPMMYSSQVYGHREGKNCGTYQCEFCHRVFRYKTWLTRHLETKHPGQTPTVSFAEVNIKPKPESIDSPAAAAAAEEDKIVEELTPEQIQMLKAAGKGKRLKIFPCSLCGRRFSSKTNVRRHKRLIHKILVRPRRTRLPYPEYTVEEEEKPKKSPDYQKQAKANDAPSPAPPAEKVTHLSSENASAPPVSGMRKPRKNKSPLKRSRGMHSQEAFAESYLTFPIEPNPNPLSAFIPTKPETIGMESSTSRNAGTNQRETTLGSTQSVKKITQTILPSHSPLSESNSSRRTGPPPATVSDKSKVSPSEQAHPRSEESIASKHVVQNVDATTWITGHSSANVSVHRRKPSSVTHHLQPVPYEGKTSNKIPPKTSHQTHQTIRQSTYNIQKASINPPYGTNSSSAPNTSHNETGLWKSSSNSQRMIVSSGKVKSEPVKPISTNPWVCARKPQPFVPRKTPSGKVLLGDKKEQSQTFRCETPITQSLSATHTEQKLDTLSVLNLKRKDPSPPAPPPHPPISEDGVLDLTVRKKARIDSTNLAQPTYSSPPEPTDPNQPLDLSSGCKTNKSLIRHSNTVISTQQANLARSYASSSSSSSSSKMPAGVNYANINASPPNSGPKYEFHHMSPASFGGTEHISSSKPGPKKKKSVQQILQQQDTLVKKANKDNIQLPPKIQQTPSMQIHTMQPKSGIYRPLLPKTSQSGQNSASLSGQKSSQSPKQPISSQLSPPQGVKQLSPHLVAAQVVKQAHAQSALRPILPKPVPGAATPVFIGGKVVATASPQQKQYESQIQRQNPSDDNGLESRVEFACNVCEVSYASIKLLAKHVVVHAQEWPYKCEFCVRLYQDAEELIQHRTKLHHVGKTFSCGVCKRDFAYKSNLKKHQTEVHNLLEMNYRELGPKELRAHNFTDPAKIKTGPPELPAKPERVSFIQQEMKKQAPVKIGKLKLPLKPIPATPSPTKSTPSPRKSIPINPQRHHPFAYARQIGYLNMLNDPRNQEVLQTVSVHRCTKCSKEFTETTEFHGHIMECALQGMDKIGTNNKEKEKTIDAERHAVVTTEKKMKMKAYTKSKKKAIQQRQGLSGSGKRQRAKPGLKTYNPQKYTRRRSSASVDDVHACPGCDKKFYFINKLERHMRLCPNRDKFKGMKATVDSNADNANKDILKKGHCCPFCNRQFTYLKSLKKHALVCLARNPNEEDPIRLIEENFKNAQKMAAELHNTEAKPTKDNAGENSRQLKTGPVAGNNNGNGKKRRRRKKRTDIIPRPKKRRRMSATNSEEEEKVMSESPRKVGPRKGIKKNKLLIKMGQRTPPKKPEANTLTTKQAEVVEKKKVLVKVDQKQSEAKDKSETAANVTKGVNAMKVASAVESAKVSTDPEIKNSSDNCKDRDVIGNVHFTGQREQKGLEQRQGSSQDKHNPSNDTFNHKVSKVAEEDSYTNIKHDKQPVRENFEHDDKAAQKTQEDTKEDKQDDKLGIKQDQVLLRNDIMEDAKKGQTPMEDTSTIKPRSAKDVKDPSVAVQAVEMSVESPNWSQKKTYLTNQSSTTRTLAHSNIENGTVSTPNGQNEHDELPADVETKGEKTSLKSYPMRSRIQSTS